MVTSLITDYSLLYELKAVHADQDIAVGIHFQQIAVERVEPQAADGERGIVFELQDLLRIAHRHQTFLDEVEAQLFVLRRLVLCVRKNVIS